MELQDLIEILQDIADKEGNDMDSVHIKVATQPTWPLAFELANVCYDEKKKTIWLATSQGNCSDHPYAPKAAFTDGVIECDEDESCEDEGGEA